MLYAYVRCSTQEQADSGLGLEAQRAAITATAAKTGQTIAAWFADEGQSGGSGLDKRVGLADALATLGKGDTLIVAKRDRLSRDPMLAGWIDKEAKRGGWRVLSAAGEGTENDDPTSMLMRRIIDAFAEYEKLLIGFRTKLALKAKRARGEKTGGHTPYGFALTDGLLVEAATEQAAIARIRADYHATRNYSKVARGLNGDGVATRTGAKWSAKTVRDIVRGDIGQ